MQMQRISPMVQWASRVFAAGFVAALAALVMAFVLPATAQAAGVVGNGTPASCTDATYAAAMAGGGMVTFDCGANPVTIEVTTKVILADEETTVDGGGLVTLDGVDLIQHFIVSSGGTLHLRDITLTRGGGFNGGALAVHFGGSASLLRVTMLENGEDVNQGGAIYNQGNVTIDQSIINQNRAIQFGGAILSTGQLTIRDSDIGGNRTTGAASSGGGIWNDGDLVLLRSTVSHNRTLQNGGGIYNDFNVTATNSTIHENVALQGGGIFAGGIQKVTLTNVTVSRNNADTAGNIWNGGSTTITLKNTIVADGSDTDENDINPSLNCDGPPVTSLGNNLITDNTCVNGADPTDLRNTPAGLTFIGNNGGFSSTVLIEPTSAAVNTGSNTDCPATDQRGNFRPIGGTCDIGAVELGVADGAPGMFLPLVLLEE